MTHMQRAGRVGRDELNNYFPGGSWFDTKLRTGLQHFAHGFLLCGSFELDVDEAWPGNFNRFNPRLVGRISQQNGFQVVGNLARVLF